MTRNEVLNVQCVFTARLQDRDSGLHSARDAAGFPWSSLRDLKCKMLCRDPRVVLASGSSTAGCKACGKSVEETLVEQSVRIKTLGGGARPIVNGKVAVRLCDAKAPVFMRVRTVLRRSIRGAHSGATKVVRRSYELCSPGLRAA